MAITHSTDGKVTAEMPNEVEKIQGGSGTFSHTPKPNQCITLTFKELCKVTALDLKLENETKANGYKPVNDAKTNHPNHPTLRPSDDSEEQLQQTQQLQEDLSKFRKIQFNDVKCQTKGIKLDLKTQCLKGKEDLKYSGKNHDGETRCFRITLLVVYEGSLLSRLSLSLSLCLSVCVCVYMCKHIYVYLNLRSLP